jgi:hypothetical protein
MAEPAIKEKLHERIERLSSEQLVRLAGYVDALTEPRSERAWVEPPRIVDAAERRRLLGELLDDMQRHPLPMNAPRFTRDELHARR